MLRSSGISLFNTIVKRSVRLSSSNSNLQKLVVTERRGPVFLIGINRPEKRNCVNLETAELLVRAFRDFENDSEASVAVLHGKGGTFCAGFDLGELATKEHLVDEAIRMLQRGVNFMGPSRRLTSKATVAAVDGHAVAGGLELALLCDLRVVDTEAVVGVFCRRFGVPLLDGGTVRLPQLIGLSRALDLILTGRAVDAREAHQMGLANRIVASGTALESAISLARTLSEFPQECLRADRKSAYYSTFEATSLQDALDFELRNAKHVVGLESVQGAQKFVSGFGKHGQFGKRKNTE